MNRYRMSRLSTRYIWLIIPPGSLAKLFVYSMAVDGPVRRDATDTPGQSQPGYLAGSKALDSLDKLFTSTESFFHPSNFGPWSMLVGVSPRTTG